MTRSLLITTFFSATTLFGAGCKGGHKSSSKMPPLRVESAVATSKQLPDKILFSTSTEPIRSVTIEPRVNGYLESVNYLSGEPVVRGDLLFQIDRSEFLTQLYSAQAELESAQAALVNARNNYHRAVPLARLNAISATSLDDYTASYRAAEAALKSAEQALKSSQLNLSYTTINAPISGLIAETPANEGDYVGPATKFETLTTISQIDTLTLSLAIPTSRYMSYNDGRSFDNRELLSNITLLLPDGSEYGYQGLYDYTQKSASSGSSTVVIVAKIPNPDALLKSNMFARVRADIGGVKDRVVVPQRAVTQMQGVNSLWVINPDSSLTYRVVELGDTYGDDWQINSGLSVGERVATSSQLKLHQGAKVIPITQK